MRPASDDPRLGQTVDGRYLLRRRLGEGGMGTVYEALHVRIDKVVALKALRPGLAHDADTVRRFQNEARAAARIGHAHIVDVSDFGQFDDGAHYIVMEYLEGRDWADDLERDGAQSLVKSLAIARQVCDALGAAHAEGILHRDLKPENILLVTERGQPNFVKVLDFGVAKLRHDEKQTTTGNAVGTPYSMAPEQAEARPDIDERVDIYALGVSLYRALSGHFPFREPSAAATLVAILTKEPTPLGELRPDLPIAVCALVHRMMARSRDARPASFDEVAGELDRLGELVEDDPTASTVPDAHAPTGLIPPASTPADAVAPTMPSIPPRVDAIDPVREPARDPRGAILGVIAGLLVGVGAMAYGLMSERQAMSDAGVVEEADADSGGEPEAEAAPEPVVGPKPTPAEPEPKPEPDTEPDTEPRMRARRRSPAMRAAARMVLPGYRRRCRPGGTGEHRFVSDIPGAIFFIDGRRVGPSPAVVHIPETGRVSVRLESDDWVYDRPIRFDASRDCVTQFDG